MQQCSRLISILQLPLCAPAETVPFTVDSILLNDHVEGHPMTHFLRTVLSKVCDVTNKKCPQDGSNITHNHLKYISTNPFH